MGKTVTVVLPACLMRCAYQAYRNGCRDNGAGCCRPDKAGRRIRRFPLPTNAKKPIRQDGLFHLFDAWQFPTLAWGDPTLPSALRRFTSEFGMGSGGTTALQPPGKFCLSDRFSRSDVICNQAEIDVCLSPKHLRRCKVKPHGSLVSVSSMYRYTYTPDLSTS